MPADNVHPIALKEVLSGAITLSGQMLEVARSGDWDRLAVLERERSRLLNADLTAALANAPADAALQVKEGLATCLRLNDEIAALTRVRMERLRELLAAMTEPGLSGAPPVRPPG